MLPSFINAVLWSYDTSRIDPKKDKKIIISQVLNFGSKDATEWVFKTYGKDEIRKVADTIPASSWDKKSLHFWSLILHIHPPQKRIL